MLIRGKHHRSLWPARDGRSVAIIDQRVLPHRVRVARLRTLADCAAAITGMAVRGAPLIGATAAYGVALALRKRATEAGLEQAVATLAATRPTAVNLRWALDEMHAALVPHPEEEWVERAWRRAEELCDADVATNEAIGRHGYEVLFRLWTAKHGGSRTPLQLLTHCNAGWIATVDWGTALAPVYRLVREGVPVHVWVDETRPRNQGASLTCWELKENKVPHTLIVDNAGGHLMQHGRVDAVIVGADRVTARGDVANKVGTYLKALAAMDNGVPFHVALPGSTFDFTLQDGRAEIPIEERPAREVTHQAGRDRRGRRSEVALAPAGTVAANPAFDVTPARLVTSLITERGVCAATEKGIVELFPEARKVRRREVQET